MNVPEFRPRNGGIRQGEVYESGGAGQYVVVVSNDDYNAAADPECVRVIRSQPRGPYVVPLADADPVGGRVLVGPVVPVPRGELSGPHGMVTGQTWARLADALRLLFDL